MFKSKSASSPAQPSRTENAPPATPRLILNIEGGDRKTIAYPLRETIVIGRGGEGQQPHIDLDMVGAKDLGVSRHHAQFTVKDETLYIEDLESTNGTRINGYELQPHKPYRITQSDEIELGDLRLTVRMLRA
jgi:pSer/pThr/pTyr-binding forkhead associated (FHA) protein